MITVTKENFHKEVISSSTPVLLDFWAEWCGPCRMMSPVLQEVSTHNPSVKIGKVNVDQQPQLAQAFQIANIPTLVLIQDGQVQKMSVGLQSRQQVEAMFHEI